MPLLIYAIATSSLASIATRIVDADFKSGSIIDHDHFEITVHDHFEMIDHDALKSPSTIAEIRSKRQVGGDYVELKKSFFVALIAVTTSRSTGRRHSRESL